MAHTGKPRTLARTPVTSRFVTLFVVLVLAFQGFLVQTHFHNTSPVAPHIVHLSTSSPSTPTPIDPLDPASCPLCQEILHASPFVVPVVISLPLQLDWIASYIPVAVSGPIAVWHGLSWQSRAPPRR